jgi:hypothetical protein
VRVTQLGTVAVLAAALSLAGCTQSAPSGPGVVTGMAPLCSGPGPNLNLSPTTTVRATAKSDGWLTTIRIVANNKQHAYRLSLAPGAYAIGISGWPTVAVVVRSGRTLTGVNLPGPICL